MDSSAMMIWGVLFGAIGIGYFSYGRKQQAIVPLCVGIALCIVPYFVSSLSMLLLVGLLLAVLPYFIRW
ncbi:MULTISPECIES: hypothetical protein [unclassified Agarivorans]|uniref:hypothetical protein n=1 Tax=unclassified Agarivorans TaxID=2636026 RepID=UPI003D7D8DA8